MVERRRLSATTTWALADAGVDTPQILLQDPTTASVMARFAPGVVRADAIAAIKGTRDVLAVEDARALYTMVQQYLGLFYVFVGIMLLFGAVMAFALMFNTISVNVSERSTEFATLKASGMADRTIAWMIVGENVLLTLVGIVPGVLVGLWFASAYISSFANDSFALGLSVHPLTILVAVVAMIAVALLSLIPGIRSMKRLDVGAVVRERSV